MTSVVFEIFSILQKLQSTCVLFSGFQTPAGGPDTALSVWVAEQQEVTGTGFPWQSLLFLRHPDVQSDVWATSPNAGSALEAAHPRWRSVSLQNRRLQDMFIEKTGTVGRVIGSVQLHANRTACSRSRYPGSDAMCAGIC